MTGFRPLKAMASRADGLVARAAAQPPQSSQSANLHDSARAYLAARDQVIVERDLILANEIRVTPPANVATVFEGLTDSRSRPIFLQHVNPEVLACYNVAVTVQDNGRFLKAAAEACKLLILLTDAHLTIPASCLFEIPNFRLFIERVYPLVLSGGLRYVASVPDLAAYREGKISEYRHDSINPYRSVDRGDAAFAFMDRLKGGARHASTTATDIAVEWTRAIEPGGPLFDARRSAASRWPGRKSKFVRLLESAPSRLDGQAFIGRFVRRVLPIELLSAEGARLDSFISQAYLRSYVLDLDANLVVDFPCGELSCGLRPDTVGMENRLLSYVAFSTLLRLSGVERFLRTLAAWDDILAVRETPELSLLGLFAFKPANLVRVRVAAVRARSARRLREATDLQNAMGNLRLMADELCS